MYIYIYLLMSLAAAKTICYTIQPRTLARALIRQLGKIYCLHFSLFITS